MLERFSIHTPDNVELEFEPAGPASRFTALLVDGAVIVASILLLLFILLSLFKGGGSDINGLLRGSFWAVALLILFIFLVTWGYYLFFESWWNGQTPGKRLMGMRVVRDDGLPVSLRQCAIRNLVRAADMLPPVTYLLGGVVALLEPRGRRLGDLAAGTVVVRERFAANQPGYLASGAGWVARLEAGQSRQAITLPRGRIEAAQVEVIRQFMARRFTMQPAVRGELAWKLSRPYLEMMGEEPDRFAASEDRQNLCESVLREILSRAEGDTQANQPTETPLSAGRRKRREWLQFEKRIRALQAQGKAGLRRLSALELSSLIEDYRRVTADLARARSLGGDQGVVQELNRIAASGHNLIYGHSQEAPQGLRPPWWSRFPTAVRRNRGAVLLASALLFGPAALSYFAVKLNPQLGFDLVADVFFEFEPATQENLHDIPPLTRPIVATSIITNNIQVTLLAFGLGLTFGLGTAFVLVYNGIHIGAIAGWLSLQGNARAFWGWIMPHGGTELLAIVLAGGAGFVLAEALVSPGDRSRRSALRKAALQSLTIELGVMLMLVVAGLIEGFVSPSPLGYSARILFLLFSVASWAAYLGLSGRRS